MGKVDLTSTTSKAVTRKSVEEETGNPHTYSGLHVYTSEDMIKRITKGYAADKDFAALFDHVRNEKADERKYRAYRISQNGLLYFEDANTNIQLCIHSVE